MVSRTSVVMHLRHIAGLPLATKALVIATLVLGGLTMAAAAREPRHAGMEAAHPKDEATAPAGGQLELQQATTSTEPAGAAADNPEGATLASAQEAEAPAAAHGEGPGRFRMPLQGWTVTDRYGASRGPGLIHGGIDLALEAHTAVMAACAGVVASASYSATYGYHVIVDCGDGWGTLYGHLSEIKAAPGQAVTQATLIGVSGSTGFSTGEHLHFEVRWKGVPVNPESYLDFHIAPGTPLSSGPITFGKPAAKAPTAADVPTPTPAPDTPTPLPTPTATKVPPTATATATPTVTPTPTKRPAGRTPTAPPAARSD